MASGTFKTTLLLTPLLSSTCTLLFSHSQQTFLSILTHPTVVSKGSNSILPAYFDRFFIPGTAQVVSFLAITTWSSLGAVYMARPLLNARGSVAWYFAAAALATGHLAFVPAVAPRIKSMLDNEGGDVQPGSDEEKQVGGRKSNVRYMEEWLQVNLIRTATVDLSAFICAAVAIIKTFSE